jgi:hypothetical protein
MQFGQLDPAIRFNLAYEAARTWCEVVLRAQGLRMPGGLGHHEKTIAAASKVLGPEFQRLFDYIDDARKSRNKIMYDGEIEAVTAKDAEDLASTVDKLETLVTGWLNQNHPDLMPLV